jgi:N-acetyl-anhydromuramoyl-L-alanine amidase
LASSSCSGSAPPRAGGVDAVGWLDAARRVPSPNFDARPAGVAIEALFTNRLDAAAHPYFATIAGLRVSAHCLVRRSGEVVQFVSLADRAWHAGVSSWRGRERCNDFSIGIELEGVETDRFEDAQYASLARIVQVLRARYPIAALVGHSDIAPARKSDPGAGFDWTRLLRA